MATKEVEKDRDLQKAITKEPEVKDVAFDDNIVKETKVARETFDRILPLLLTDPEPPNKPTKLPCFDKVFLDYSEARSQLLKAEEENTWDRHAREQADDIEKQAGAIIRAIREYERDNTFGNKPGEALPGPLTLDMGGQFLTNKNRIEKRSILFDIAKQVPKGAILHLHYNAELHPQRLLEEARDVTGMCIRSTQPILNEDDLDKAEVALGVPYCNRVNADVDIFSEGYPEGPDNNIRNPLQEPKLWMKWSTFQKKYKELYGHKHVPTDRDIPKTGPLPNSSEQGPVHLTSAETYVLKKMILSEEESYDPKQTVNGVWARFNIATRCFKGLVNYETMYKSYISRAIDHLIEEKIMYAELRPMLMDKDIPSDDGTKKFTNAKQMEMIAEAVQAKKVEKGDKFPFGLKIIYCTPRSIDTTRMRTELKDCIDLKIQYPDLICGFDLVGAEDRPNHIGFYAEELVAFQKTCEEKNLDIPFMFHAGETLLDTGGSADRDPSKSNLYDACLLKCKRIGHGFSLLKHPQLLSHFRKTETQPGICIELCPISNELLHLCRNVKEHPYPELLAAGIPCTINSDNPSLFSNSMSHEFYQIMVGAPSITIHSWKQLALWSLEYSCLSEAEKKKGKEIFLRDWEAFCQEVVDKYGTNKDSKLGDFGNACSFNIKDEEAAEQYKKKPSENSVRKS